MNERDTLQLFDLALAREIISLDREALWRFVEERTAHLRSMPRRMSMFILPDGHPRGPRIAFDEFFDEDPADVRQPLIMDLCYRGPRMRISYFARAGYLDSHLSVPTGGEDSVIGSQDLLPWRADSEAWYWAGRYEVLTARHVGLMITSLNEHRAEYVPLPPEEPKSYYREAETPADLEAEIEFLTSVHYSLITDPSLRAAFAYQV